MIDDKVVNCDALVEGMFPDHECGLQLSHNEHKNYYESIEDYVQENRELFKWESEEHKQRAIKSDCIWQLQWYPNTPVGFYCAAAPTLREVLEWANKIHRGY